MGFVGFPKIPRLSRECVITEKLDGRNASIYIAQVPKLSEGAPDCPPPHQPDRLHHFYAADGTMWGVWAGSRNRWVTPDNDNYGFARWVYDHADELVKLGPGHHFGEWWGCGIQRGYNQIEKKFSLFNVTRWGDEAARPACCGIVPILYRGLFSTEMIENVLMMLQLTGSMAAPGFMDPEGIIVYHVAANALFKKTAKGDEEGKHAEAHPKKERPTRAPKNPSKGGRRVAEVSFAGPDRRVSRLVVVA